MTDRTILGPGGRRIGITGVRDPSADRLMLLCHPTPTGSGFDADPVVTSRWGLRLVTLGRPGYGASEPLPAGAENLVAQRAEDLADYVNPTASTVSPPSTRLSPGSAQQAAERAAAGPVGLAALGVHADDPTSPGTWD